VIVIANDARIRDSVRGRAVYGDVRPERASVVGLHSALWHARDSILVVAWDMPFVSPGLLGELRLIGERTGAAILPEGPRGPEPLCAYYPHSCIDVVEQQLAAGNFRLGALVSMLARRMVLPLEDVARFGSPDRIFANINTSADLDAAARSPDQAVRAFEQDHQHIPANEDESVSR